MLSGVLKTGAKGELRKLVSLALPLSLAHLAQTGMSFVDTLMVGRLGPTELAALALGATTFSTVNVILMAVLLSVSPLVAQALGAKREQEPGRITAQALYLAVLLAALGIVVFYSMKPVLSAVGLPPASVELAADYLKAVAFGLPFTLGFVALRGLLEGHGDARPILLMALMGVGVNVFLNDALIFGKYGLPELGMVGTGYATAVVYLLLFLGGVALVRVRYPQQRVFTELRRLDLPLLREIVRLGWPISIMLGMEVGAFSVTSFLMGGFGDAVLAGHQIAIQSSSMTFMIPLGIAAATAVRVGHAAGRGDAAGIRVAGFLGIMLGTLFMLLTAALYRFAPGVVIGLYVDRGAPGNQELIGYATTFLGIAALFQVVDGVQVTAQGALRGLKDTRIPMFLTLIAYWLVGISSGLTLTYVLGLGPRGLWFGLVVGLSLAAVMLVVRFTLLTRGSGASGARRLNRAATRSDIVPG